jgi:lipoprotein-anchoring transpeptidase ErfK/SrfK
MFYDRNTAIHGVYWPVVLGFNQSHGCVNMSPGDANWVYHWAKDGDWVYVHDPSGKTPTDPAYYGGVSTGP